MNKFGLDDLIRSFEIAFDIKKITYQLVGILTAALVLGIFILLGAMTTNDLLFAAFALVGSSFAYCLAMGTAGGVGRMIYQELANGKKMTAKEAWDFTKNHLHTLILAPLALILVMAAVIFGETIVSLLGKVPTVGSILLSLITIPLITLNIFLIMTMTFGAMLVIAMVATEELPISAVLWRVYKIIRTVPIELIVYTTIAMLIAGTVATGVLLIYLGGIVLSASVFWAPIQNIVSLASLGEMTVPSGLTAAGIISGISLSILTLFVLCYPLVFGQGIAISVYLALKERIKS